MPNPEPIRTLSKFLWYFLDFLVQILYPGREIPLPCLENLSLYQIPSVLFPVHSILPRYIRSDVYPEEI